MKPLLAMAGLGVALLLGAVAPTRAAQPLTLRPLVVADAGKQLERVKARTAQLTDAKILGLDLVPSAHDTVDPTANAYGTVIVEVDISATGKLTKCKVMKTSGYRSLDERALRTLQAAKYKAATVAGRPVAGAYTVNVGFDLDD